MIVAGTASDPCTTKSTKNTKEIRRARARPGVVA